MYLYNNSTVNRRPKDYPPGRRRSTLHLNAVNISVIDLAAEYIIIPVQERHDLLSQAVQAIAEHAAILPGGVTLCDAVIGSPQDRVIGIRALLQVLAVFKCQRTACLRFSR